MVLVAVCIISPPVLNITFDEDPDDVVCEVQLIHQKLMLARKGMAGHKDYVAFRSSVELLEAVAAQSKYEQHKHNDKHKHKHKRKDKDKDKDTDKHTHMHKRDHGGEPTDDLMFQRRFDAKVGDAATGEI